MPAQSRKGCWTCKQRKVACDRDTPTCRTCRQSGRCCEGYDARLSWPRRNDRRRAIVSTLRQMSQILTPIDFVNVFWSDIQLHQNMLDSGTAGVSKHSGPVVAEDYQLSPSIIDESDRRVYYCFLHNVWQTFKMANNPYTQHLVTRMSFAAESMASSAIVDTIYALLSLHYSDRFKALEYKTSAVKAIWASAAQHTAAKEVFRRIVAVNLLAVFETLSQQENLPACASDLCWFKTAEITTYALGSKYEGDLALVFDWVYYYDVLTKFTTKLWDQATAAKLLHVKKQSLMHAALHSSDPTHISLSLGCSIEVLTTISTLLNHALQSQSQLGEPPTEIVDSLDRRLRYAQQEVPIEELDNQQSQHELQQIRDTAELYRLSGLIYLHRALRKTSSTSTVLKRFISDAFSTLVRLEVCPRAFPLLIVACEARTDDQRALVLNVLNATQIRLPSTNVCLRGFIERFWAADDLDVGDDVEYTSKLKGVLSGNQMLCVFA